MNTHFLTQKCFISLSKKAFMQNIASISLICVLDQTKVYTKYYLQLHYTAAGWSLQSRPLD